MTQAAGVPGRAARIYVTAVSVAGAAVLAYCVSVLVRRGIHGQWLLLSALTFACGRFTLVVPGAEARFAVSEMTGIACVLLFGPEAGAITLALDCLILSCVRRMSADKIFFNVGNLSLSVWISGSL